MSDQQDRKIEDLEKEVKDLRTLLTIVCVKVGLDPKTGNKTNGLFASQEKQGQRIGKIEQDLKHNVTWPGFFRAIIACSAVAGALLTLLTILLRSIK